MRAAGLRGTNLCTARRSRFFLDPQASGPAQLVVCVNQSEGLHDLCIRRGDPRGRPSGRVGGEAGGHKARPYEQNQSIHFG